MDTDDRKAHRARVARVRRKAARLGLTVSVNRRRDQDAPDYNAWQLYADGEPLLTDRTGYSIEAVEVTLGLHGKRNRERRRAVAS